MHLGAIEYVKKQKEHKYETDLITNEIYNKKDELIDYLLRKRPDWSWEYAQEIANRMIKEQVPVSKIAALARIISRRWHNETFWAKC